MDWIVLAQDRDWWKALVNAEPSGSIWWEVLEWLHNSGALSRMVQLHGVS
jgi:hypothetical protein